MSMTEDQKSLNKQLETISWGLFFVGIGLIWAMPSIYQTDIKGGGFILIGALLIGLNFVRRMKNIPISKFTTFIGIILFLVGISDFAGFKLPLFETVIILIGLFIVLGAITKMR
ncbi:hypothetical protein [[Eubacterium] cellulosolvens]